MNEKTIETRARELIEQMSVDEKIAQFTSVERTDLIDKNNKFSEK